MILFLENEVNKATIQSDQATGSLPASNIKDQRLSHIFRGEEYTELNINGAGSLKNISQAYTNLMQDPTDLTTGNWTLTNGATVILSSETFQGLPMTKIGSTTATANPSIHQDIAVSNGVNVLSSIVLRNENYESGDTIDMFFLEIAPVEGWSRISIDFIAKTVTKLVGDSLKYVWRDDDTVEIFVISNITDDIDGRFRIDPDPTGDSTKYFHATSCQVVDDTTTFFPFIDGSKTADVIDETFTMPDRFTFDIIINPDFAYDTAIDNISFLNYKNGSPEFQLFYQESVDNFQIAWGDGGTIRVLTSQQFDDGISFTNINQKIRFTGSVDLISGGINDSRFIICPKESGSLFEDSSWSGSPDVKTTIFETLSIGNRLGSKQADSQYEYLRIYAGLLVGPVTSSDDIDELLKDKKLLFDKTYQQKLTATDLLIANSTINDGDTIILRANDVDSFGPGAPLDETIVWSKDIIKHNFLKSTLQYWRLFVNSSNIIDIGRVYLGPRYVSPGMAVLVPHSRITTTRKTISYGGQTYGDKGHFASLIQLRFPKITRDEYNELVEIWETTDIDTAFFVTFDKGGNILDTKYVTFDQEEFKLVPLGNRDLYNTNLKFIEEVK